MRCKNGHKNPKRRAYGQQRGLSWCNGCDGELVRNKVSKAKARRENKKAIADETGKNDEND